MVDVQLVKEWIDALESGGYSQIRRKLRQNGRFCCLGVLCDRSNFGTWTINPQYSESIGKLYYLVEEDKDVVTIESMCYIPTGLAAKLGSATEQPNNRSDIPLAIPPWLISKTLKKYYSIIDEATIELEDAIQGIEDDLLEGRDVYVVASELNDTLDYTFQEIADCIRYTFRSFL